MLKNTCLLIAGIIILYSVCNYISTAATPPSLTDSWLQFFLSDFMQNLGTEPQDEFVGSQEYDFIVVGAGSAGSIVANRLSEVPDWEVLLIEAGSQEQLFQDIPIMANSLQLTNANWKYKTQPSNNSCLAFKNKRCNWPRGKVMGGSSTINYMIYTRGNKRDYDHWEKLGNEGWGWKNVLPYFKKVENITIPEYAANKEYHSTKGYMPISYIPYRTKIADAFVKAGTQDGLNIVDYNGETQVGVNYLQVTMRDGLRWSSSRAYLHPIRKRKNLKITKQSLAMKIIIEPETKKATGVQYYKNGKKYVAKARKEIILSGGTINSAQLLMLSGIGPKKHLQRKKITVIQDLPVGFNLKDHAAPGGLTFTIDFPYTVTRDRIYNNRKIITDYYKYQTGPISLPGGCEAIAFYDLQHPQDPNGHPDLELFLIAGSLKSDSTLKAALGISNEIYEAVYGNLTEVDSVIVVPMPLKTKSVGRVMLKNSNPFSKPLIYPNYYSDKEGYDMKVSVEGIKKAKQLMSKSALQKLGARLYTAPIPACKQYNMESDEYWQCYTRHFTFTIYHHIGTCRMGPDNDKNSVVDPKLRVKGIKNLRVIDASVMPEMPAAHTNGPTYMIAEKGSDMIKEDWGVRIRKITKN